MPTWWEIGTKSSILISLICGPKNDTEKKKKTGLGSSSQNRKWKVIKSVCILKLLAQPPHLQMGKIEGEMSDLAKVEWPTVWRSKSVKTRTQVRLTVSSQPAISRKHHGSDHTSRVSNRVKQALESMTETLVQWHFKIRVP